MYIYSIVVLVPFIEDKFLLMIETSVATED